MGQSIAGHTPVKTRMVTRWANSRVYTSIDVAASADHVDGCLLYNKHGSFRFSDVGSSGQSMQIAVETVQRFYAGRGAATAYRHLCWPSSRTAVPVRSRL